MLIIIVSPFSSCIRTRSVLTVTRSLINFQSVSPACLSAAFVNISMCVDQLTNHTPTGNQCHMFILGLQRIYDVFRNYT